jgi:hypothetical protein
MHSIPFQSIRFFPRFENRPSEFQLITPSITDGTGPPISPSDVCSKETKFWVFCPDADFRCFASLSGLPTDETDHPRFFPDRYSDLLY